ncbi:ATP-binding protein [Bartonella tamiae]|uniref:Uncharacterized protein n=1 Tax=Bartonella tamiae Th239 TaxID=1094558 RepID=J0ZQ14_9HYPH|nr:ATP-binding protein [Bartonella tamiae]EJF90703.1 hypothetical protein ME5_01104 [Bartonella tamiae Th239]EJF93920.1 hypothetical protein MEG_00778 [Bartonella tamiae Th307]
MQEKDILIQKLDELVAALNRIAPPEPEAVNLDYNDCFVWNSEKLKLHHVKEMNFVDIDLLMGIDSTRDILLNNTRQFAHHLPANNILLWGARGMGKSSLVKSAQVHVNQTMKKDKKLKLIEINREDINTLPILMTSLRNVPYQCILFCDDLSFDHDDTSYKSLKTALDGGIEGRPNNVLLYATSNRRHLMPRDMIDNERSSAINPSEATEEKVSLSDRFGLWLGFHKCNQDDYLAMIDGYVKKYNLQAPREDIHKQALEWETTRGNRSGRVAWQFIQHLAGMMGQTIA